jgi:hypothetical protein
MIRIYAKFVIVLRAVVKHMFSFGNFTIVNKPRRYVRANGLPVFSYIHGAVTTSANGTRPNPARSSFINFSPKAFSKRVGKPLFDQELRRNLLHSSVSARLALQALPGLFMMLFFHRSFN